jgi:hypothetical protein
MKWKEFTQRGLSEDNGNPSSIRVNTGFTIWILVPCVAFTLIYTVLNYQSLVTYVLDAVLFFIAGLFGIKVWQKTKETKVDIPQPAITGTEEKKE